MATATMKRSEGSDVGIDSSALDDLSGSLGGSVLTTSSDGHDEARVILERDDRQATRDDRAVREHW